MNRTKNTIGWCDFSWNPITGCLNNCWYCYAKKIYRRFNRSFEPAFHPERLEEPLKLKKAAKIFCCSVSDLFAAWTKPEWREEVLKVIEKSYKMGLGHIFQLLTKQPQLIDVNYGFPNNVWLGVTVTESGEANKIDYLRRLNVKTKFVSFEPLLGHVNMNLDGIDWVIIGKLTGSRQVRLDPKWVKHLITEARKKEIPVFVKDNVGWKKKIQEFPKVI